MTLLEMVTLGMGNKPDSQTAVVCVSTGGGTRKPQKVFYHLFSPLSCPFPFHSFLPILNSPQLSSRGSFLYLNSTSPELLHCLMQTLCPHLSDSTPLRKTLLADYYLRVDSFEQTSVEK